MTRTTILSLGALLASTTVAAQQQPPFRQLGPVMATSPQTYGQQVFVRHVKNGVLVNDVAGRRLMMLDPTLTKFSVVADSTPATVTVYSGQRGNIIAYRGDSTMTIAP